MAMHRNIFLLYIHNLLTDFRFQAPFAVIYFHQITGSYAQAMLVLSLEVLAAALLDIPTGIFSDKVGRKYTLALGSMSYACSLACYAFAPSMGMLVLGAILFGFALALFSGNNNALLFETLKGEGIEDRYPHYLGRVSSMFQIGLTVSALLASFIAPHGLKFVFIAGIVPQILGVFTALQMTEPPTRSPSGKRGITHLLTALSHVWNNPRLRLLTFAQSINYGFGEAAFTFNTAFMNMLVPTWGVSLYRAVAHLFAFISFWFAGPILRHIKDKVLLTLGSAYATVSALAAVAMTNLFSPILFVSGSLFFGANTVAYDHLIQKEFNDEQRATLGSISSFGSRLVSGIGALGLGGIADGYGVPTALAVGVIASGMALPIYLYVFNKHYNAS